MLMPIPCSCSCQAHAKLMPSSCQAHASYPDRDCVCFPAHCGEGNVRLACLSCLSSCQAHAHAKLMPSSCLMLMPLAHAHAHVARLFALTLTRSIDRRRNEQKSRQALNVNVRRTGLQILYISVDVVCTCLLLNKELIPQTL